MAKTLKETLIRTTAVRLAISEKVVESIINHQFISCIEAMDTNHSVELSGFGKFVFNVKKGKKYAEDLERFVKQHQQELDNPNRKRGIESLSSMMATAKEQLRKLKPMLGDD